jgi:hypothetical protein
VLVARDGAEVASLVESLDMKRARAIGHAAYRRVLAQHTYDHRAAQLDAVLSVTSASSLVTPASSLVTPAKAGVQAGGRNEPVNPATPGLDSRFRGNDENGTGGNDEKGASRHVEKKATA